MIYKIFTIICLVILTIPVNASTEPHQILSSSDEGTPKGSVGSSADSTPVKPRPIETPVQLLSEATRKYKELAAAGVKPIVNEAISNLFERAAIGFYASEEVERAAKAYINAAITTADLKRKEALYVMSSGCYTEIGMSEKAQETADAQRKMALTRAKRGSAASQPIVVEAQQPTLPFIGRRPHESPPSVLPAQEEESVSASKPLTLADRLQATGDPLEKAKLYVKSANQFRSKGEHESAAVFYLKGVSFSGDDKAKIFLTKNAGEQFLLAAEKEPAGNVEKQSLLHQNAGECFSRIEDFRKAVECYGIAKDLTSDRSRKQLLDGKIEMCYRPDQSAAAVVSVAASQKSAMKTVVSQRPAPAEYLRRAEELFAKGIKVKPLVFGKDDYKQASAFFGEAAGLFVLGGDHGRSGEAYYQAAKARVKSLEQEKATDKDASELFEAAGRQFALGGKDAEAAKSYERAFHTSKSTRRGLLSDLALELYTKVNDKSGIKRMAEEKRRFDAYLQRVSDRDEADQRSEEMAAENRRFRELHMRTLGLVLPDGTGNRDLPWPIIETRYKELTTGARAKYLTNLPEIQEAYKWLDAMTTKS